MVTPMAAAAARLGGCHGAPAPQTFESIAAGSARTRRGGLAAMANCASSPSSRRGRREEQRLPPGRRALSNVASAASGRGYSREGDLWRPSRMAAEVDELNGGARGSFPSPPVILWEKDLANAVQLIGRVGRDVQIEYLDSGKVVATTSLAVHKGSQRTEDPSWFTLEIWDDLAEIAARHVTKGALILVAGKVVVETRVKDVKVVLKDLCFVESSSERRQRHCQSSDEFTVRGSSSQSQAEVASMNSSQRIWNQQQLSGQLSQGGRGHGNNIAQLEAQFLQTRAGASKWREAVKMIDQNRTPSLQVVGEIKSRQQNTESLKVELKRVGDRKANLTKSITANDVPEIREPEPPSREEEGPSSPISEGVVTENSVTQDLSTEELVRKSLLMDADSTAKWREAGLNVNAHGGLESAPTCDSRDWSRDNAKGNGSMHMHNAGTTSEAIAVLQNRLQRGITINRYTCAKVLHMCLKQKDLLAAKQVHDCIIQSGMDKNLQLAVTLLDVYIKCGALLDAREVFDQLEKKTVVTWSNMIGGYAKSGHAEAALELFNQMRQEGVEPNEITYLSILNACASPLALKWGQEVHEYIRKAGFESDVRVGTALLNMYAKCGCITEARRVFEKLTNRNVITWTVMIGGLAQHGCGYEAYQLFLQMRREGKEPNAFTYASILNPSASAGSLQWVKEVHVHASKAGLESDLRVSNALVHMYAESGSIDDARLVFDRMEKRDVVTWNAMIGGLAQHGHGHEAHGLFCQMRGEGFEPNAITCASILNASASTGALEWVKEVHGHATKSGLVSDLRVGNALVHMYAKSGSIDDARLLFDRMEKRDVITWNAMIGGLAQHGCGHDALDLFRNMSADLVKPDGTTFVAVLSACCHGGLVDEGLRLFSAIEQDYGFEYTVEHCNCMVDLLGRSGHLGEAKRFISAMPVQPNVVTWTALLGACRTYGDVDLAELAASELFILEPSKASTYVQLSNIYAAAGQLEKVSSVRALMQERRVRKEPGRSWIEVDNKIHEFVVGDTTHPEAEAIYAELNELSGKLRAEGYIPDTRLVLHDINEEDKELALCFHSEKLAIAYGLMRIPRGKPIRLYKNLRVCSDCHTATKFISKVTGREIIARDAIRFHHFKDGVCSCGDYW